MTDMDSETDVGAEVRYRLVRDLALDAPGLVHQLIGYLSDESWRVRKAAVDRLLEIRRHQAAIAALLEALGNGKMPGCGTQPPRPWLGLGPRPSRRSPPG